MNEIGEEAAERLLCRLRPDVRTTKLDRHLRRSRRRRSLTPKTLSHLGAESPFRGVRIKPGPRIIRIGTEALGHSAEIRFADERRVVGG